MRILDYVRSWRSVQQRRRSLGGVRGRRCLTSPRDLLPPSGRRGFGHDAEHDVEAEADGERHQDAGLHAAGRKVRLLGVYLRSMVFAEYGTGLFRIVSVEETGATHL